MSKSNEPLEPLAVVALRGAIGTPESFEIVSLAKLALGHIQNLTRQLSDYDVRIAAQRSSNPTTPALAEPALCMATITVQGESHICVLESGHAGQHKTGGFDIGWHWDDRVLGFPPALPVEAIEWCIGKASRDSLYARAKADEAAAQLTALQQAVADAQKDKSWTMRLLSLSSIEDVRAQIKRCEGNHVQQVVYSTYHDALTQVCFGCRAIRTTLPSARTPDPAREEQSDG